MTTLKKLLIAAISCSVAGHCNVMQGMNDNADSGSLSIQLFNAIDCDDIKTVQTLLTAGANINAKNNHGETALILAARRDHINIVKELIEKGADVNVQNENGNTALMHAASRGYTTIVKKLLKKGADVNAQRINGNTALMIAIRNAYGENSYRTTVKALLKAGADVDLKDNNGFTPLYYLIQDLSYFRPLTDKNDFRLVLPRKLIADLIRHGADPSTINKRFMDGKTPLDLANGIRDTQLREYVIALINRCRQRYLAEKAAMREAAKNYMIKDVLESIVDKY